MNEFFKNKELEVCDEHSQCDVVVYGFVFGQMKMINGQ